MKKKEVEEEKEANEPREKEEKATTNIQLDIPRDLLHLPSILFIPLYSVCFLSCCRAAPLLASPRGISNVVSTIVARRVYVAWIKAFLEMPSGTLFRKPGVSAYGRGTRRKHYAAFMKLSRVSRCRITRKLAVKARLCFVVKRFRKSWRASHSRVRSKSNYRVRYNRDLRDLLVNRASGVVDRLAHYVKCKCDAKPLILSFESHI